MLSNKNQCPKFKCHQKNNSKCFGGNFGIIFFRQKDIATKYSLLFF